MATRAMVIAAPDVYVQGHGAKEGQVVPRLAAGADLQLCASQVRRMILNMLQARTPDL